METPTWYRVLLAARKLAPEFTGPDLARAAKVPVSHGTAWACKLAAWGYLRRTGSLPGNGRPRITFTVTKQGAKRKAPVEVRGTRTSRAE